MPGFPLTYRWDGEAMRPLPRQAKEADLRFVIGELYELDEARQRSHKSHCHQFAFLTEAWRNLPHRYDNEPWAQSAETLRKHALIISKFCTVEAFACATRAEAERWARVLRTGEEYCIVTIDGNTIHRFRAESQSRRSMGARRFQESKQSLMNFLDDLLKVERGATEQAGEAA
jgi:hypothetical protein